MSSPMDVEDGGGGDDAYADEDLSAGVCGCAPAASVCFCCLSASLSLRAVQVSGPKEVFLLGLLNFLYVLS